LFHRKAGKGKRGKGPVFLPSPARGGGKGKKKEQNLHSSGKGVPQKGKKRGKKKKKKSPNTGPTYPTPMGGGGKGRIIGKSFSIPRGSFQSGEEERGKKRGEGGASNYEENHGGKGGKQK